MRAAAIVAIGLLIFPYSAVPAEIPPGGKVTEEELLFMEVPVVITAARREQPVSETPAAVFVIAAEEIRRSGMTTLPELPRGVPGLDAAGTGNIEQADGAIRYGGRLGDSGYFRAFVQDEITVRENVRFAVGSKFEHNTFTGFEYQPNGRLLWDIRVAVDAAAFYNRYDHLRTLEPGAPFVETDPSPPHLLIPLQFDNRMEGDTYGLEIAVQWRVADRWRLTPGYTRLKTRLRLDQGSGDTGSESRTKGSSPERQFHLLSRLDLTNNLELDASLFYVDRLAGPDIPGYFRLDLRVGWLPGKNWEFSIAGRNLLDLRHPEFSAVDLIPSEAPRSVYGRLTRRFP